MKNKLNTLTLPESQLTSAQVQDGPSNLTSLHPWFITGFSDAEGCFGIQILKSKKIKTGWEVRAFFVMSLHKRDLALLMQIVSFLGVGRI
jgi:hypothetical protein